MDFTGYVFDPSQSVLSSQVWMKLDYFLEEAWTLEVGVFFGQMSPCLVLPVILNLVVKVVTVRGADYLKKIVPWERPLEMNPLVESNFYGNSGKNV